MNTEQPRNPLHGVKLEQIVTDLVDEFGWEALAEQVNVNCFRANPSIKSSLKFLRKTQWARNKVEKLYLNAIIHELLWLKMNTKLKLSLHQSQRRLIAISGKPLVNLR